MPEKVLIYPRYGIQKQIAYNKGEDVAIIVMCARTAVSEHADADFTL